MHSMQKVVSLIIRAMGTPLAHKVNNVITSGDLSSLNQFNIDPNDYATASMYKRDAQVIATYKKLEGLDLGLDLEAKAVESFFRCEAKCKESNQRLARYENWFSRGFVAEYPEDVEIYSYLVSVRKRIGDVLGQVPLDLVPRFSNGSTYNDRGDEITIPHKISSQPTVTQNAWTVVHDLWRGTAWERAVHVRPCFVLGNRFTTVAKDSTKHRGICIEPSLSITYQLSVGAYICRQLESIGINIKGGTKAVNAQILHRRLAHKASIDGLLATLDLSDASDNICYMLVKLLLPKGWFDLLSALRSQYTEINDEWVKLHKFSSMGNGFTFELETLIFWALVQSVSEDRVLTFGDDIIVRTCDSACARAVLTFAGFTVNAKKSFWDPLTPFRESCGGDYFNGTAVRPTYLKTIPSNPAEWIVLANLVTRIKNSFKNDANDNLLKSAWKICVNQVARNYRVFGPEWAGDMVIHNEDRSTWKIRDAKVTERRPVSYVFYEHDGFRLYERRCIRESNFLLGQDTGYKELKVLDPDIRRFKLESFHDDVQLASALLQVPSTGPVPRDGISGYKTVWRATVM